MARDSPGLCVLCALGKCFKTRLPLAWIAKSKPKSRKEASEFAGFGNPAKQDGDY